MNGGQAQGFVFASVGLLLDAIESELVVLVRLGLGL